MRWVGPEDLLKRSSNLTLAVSGLSVFHYYRLLMSVMCFTAVKEDEASCYCRI